MLLAINVHVGLLKTHITFFSIVKTIQMQETNFYFNSYNKTTFVSSTPIFYYGAANHYQTTLIIICFISYKHSYKNLVDLCKNQVLMFFAIFLLSKSKIVTIINVPFIICIFSYNNSTVVSFCTNCLFCGEDLVSCQNLRPNHLYYIQ